MAETKLRLRSEIPQEYKWNSTSVFTDVKAWNDACSLLPDLFVKIEQNRGHLADGPVMVKNAYSALEEAYTLLGKILVYASISHEVETTNQDATRMQGKAYALFGQLQSAASYIDPELVAIGQDTLSEWIAKDSSLQTYAHYFDNLFRKQAHVRSAEVEEVLGMLAPIFANTETTASVLTDADFQFAPALAEDGTEVPLTQGTLDDILASPDRQARQTAWEN